jgi:hypothetical protein
MTATRIKIILAMIAIALGIAIMHFASSEERSLGIALIAIGGLLFILNFTRLKNQK